MVVFLFQVVFIMQTGTVVEFVRYALQTNNAFQLQKASRQIEMDIRPAHTTRTDAVADVVASIIFGRRLGNT